MLEATKEGIFTEGKSDFYILNWYKKYYDPNLSVDFLPIGGANNAKPIMSLYLGLALRFIFLLDSDKKGQQAKTSYLRELPIDEDQLVQIGELVPNKKEIEDLVGESMKAAIAEKYNVKTINKKHIFRAFSGALSGSNDLPHDDETIDNLRALTESLKARLNKIESH